MQIPVGQTVILEAAPGSARRAALQQWLDESKSRTWLLRFDAARFGPWAGVAEWLESLVPELPRDILVRHDFDTPGCIAPLSGNMGSSHLPTEDLSRS